MSLTNVNILYIFLMKSEWPLWVDLAQSYKRLDGPLYLFLINLRSRISVLRAINKTNWK